MSTTWHLSKMKICLKYNKKSKEVNKIKESINIILGTAFKYLYLHKYCVKEQNHKTKVGDAKEIDKRKVKIIKNNTTAYISIPT